MKNFLIGGTIIDDSAQAWAFEDVTPSQVRAFLSKLEPGEPVTFEISSPGGSCAGGLAIANLIREASANGHETTAHVIGLAASMASVVACACDKVTMDESSFVMIHNPWTIAEGDAEKLRHEADTLDKFKAAILSIYGSKFKKERCELEALMDAETWFTGAGASDLGFVAEVIPNAEPLKAAACAREIPAFANIPEGAAPLLSLAAERTVTVTECEARVRGMQSTMAKQMDALKAEHAAALAAKDGELENLKHQQKMVAEELTEAHAEVIRLTADLSKAEGELRESASALEAKETALAELNAAVNTPAVKVLPTLDEGLAKCATAAERSAFISSGLYRK